MVRRLTIDRSPQPPKGLPGQTAARYGERQRLATPPMWGGQTARDALAPVALHGLWRGGVLLFSRIRLVTPGYN